MHLHTSAANGPSCDIVIPRVRLVIVERSARWSRGSMLPGSPSDGTSIVGQRDGESPIELARRVLRAIGRIEACQGRIGRAALFVAPRLDDESMTARHVIARALLHAMRSVRETSELVVVVSAEATRELGQAIKALVDFLAWTPVTRPARIHVRFS